MLRLYTRTPGYLSIYTHDMSRGIIFHFYFIFYCTKFHFFFLKFYLKNFTWLKCLKKKNWNSPALIFVNRQFMTVFPPPSCILFFQKKIPSD